MSPTGPLKFRLFTTVEVEIEPDVLQDQHNVVARYDGHILAEASIADETVREFAGLLAEACARFDRVAMHVESLDADDFRIPLKRPQCRICGCDDDHACEGGCHWIEPDLCSACVRVPEAEGGAS